MDNFDKYVNSVLNEDSTPGGIADNKTCEQIAKKHNVSVEQIKQELEKGTKVEMEHTDSKEQAREIAKDHLVEMPDYYTKLAKMEESNVAGGAGSAFGDPSAYNIGDFGGSVGNNDFYRPGDARMPKSIFGKVLRRNMNTASTGKKKRKKKQYGRKKES